MENLQSKRYSDKDLNYFKEIVNKKLAKSERQLASLEAQLEETSANKSAESDWVDDSSNSANLQLLDTMAHRLRKHIVDLKKALLRIQKKNYGVCSITGELIDKKRLVAVPTTTKSVAAKTGKAKVPSKRTSRPSSNALAKKEKSPKIISRVLTKNSLDKKKAVEVDFDDEDWDKPDDLLEGIEQLDLKDEIED